MGGEWGLYKTQIPVKMKLYHGPRLTGPGGKYLALEATTVKHINSDMVKLELINSQPNKIINTIILLQL